MQSKEKQNACYVKKKSRLQLMLRISVGENVLSQAELVASGH